MLIHRRVGALAAVQEKPESEDIHMVPVSVVAEIIRPVSSQQIEV